MPAVTATKHLAARHFLARIGQALGLCWVLAAGAAPAIAQHQFVTTKGDLKRESWWLIADFHPFTTEVRGIPVSKIKSNWCKATEFRKELIPNALLIENGVDSMAASKLSFAVEGRFDGSATKQVALVGVYQECAGPKGRFLLILDQPQGGEPKVRFVSADRTAHQFGALSLAKDNAVTLLECMECDIHSVLKWNARKRRFAWVPVKGGD